MNKIFTLLAQYTDWLFPQCCYLCAKSLTSSLMICHDCHCKLPWNISACRQCALPLAAGKQCGACLSDPPAFNRCLTPFRYEAPISTLIVQLKFQQKLGCARILSQLLHEYIRQQPSYLPECIIPIPLHQQRLRQRGFNQALEIAKPLGKALNIPVLHNACYRRKNTLPQSQLSASARRSNIASAFALRRKTVFQHVAIIDDVMTTGHTVRALSKLLRQEGVETIDIWCCARASH